MSEAKIDHNAGNWYLGQVNAQLKALIYKKLGIV